MHSPATDLRHDAQPTNSPRQRIGHARLDPLHRVVGYFAGRFPTPGRRCTLRQLTCAMTLNRLIHPASELATPDWIRSTALSDILQVDFQLLAEDALYRNLDRLHAQRVVIEAALAERERTLFGLDQTLFLYDVTSTYFEGRALANPK